MIGEFIKQKRERAEMTQAELYNFLPVRREKASGKHGGRATISRIESGTRGIYFEQLEAIAAAFNQKASEFLAEYEKQGD